MLQRGPLFLGEFMNPNKKELNAIRIVLTDLRDDMVKGRYGCRWCGRAATNDEDRLNIHRPDCPFELAYGPFDNSASGRERYLCRWKCNDGQIGPTDDRYVCPNCQGTGYEIKREQ